MKVLGTNKESSDTVYIVEIKHSEICKVFNKSHWDSNSRLSELKINQEFNISDGYDFRGEILSAIKSMDNSYSLFASASKSMQMFAGLDLSKDIENQSGKGE